MPLSPLERRARAAEYARLHRELTALPEADFEGAAGDAVRDRMDPIWLALGCNEGVRTALAEIGEALD